MKLQTKQEENKLAQVREVAESDLVKFINLVHPQRVLGHIHEELCRWWNREGARSHQLVLLPRDHQKSALLAYRVAWEITRNPSVRILYISATSNLAQKQLKSVKDILTSPIYRKYWPEMVNVDEGKREKWTESEISVDHPKRKREIVRDPTVFTAGLTTTIVGLHCDIAVCDDVVVPDNADTKEGRNKVANQVSYLSSIVGTEGRIWVAGTRYNPLDEYQRMLETRYEVYDEYGDIVAEEELYEVFERRVEDKGDGTGEFLWPRQQRYDGRWFGFNREILAKKRAQYEDKTSFYAQYYNDPTDRSERAIKEFQYYDKSLLKQDGPHWKFKGTRLNVFAAMDFAFSTNKKADYTAIVIVGVDHLKNYYVLDIERFKTNKISEYYEHLLRLHERWDFRKLRAEVTAAQKVIIEDLKENYLKPNGLLLHIEDFSPTRHGGTKEERIQAILQPKYDNGQIYHYRGGNCQILEEELSLASPNHDDVKDCLASCIEFCVAPSPPLRGNNRTEERMRAPNNTRFGWY